MTGAGGPTIEVRGLHVDRGGTEVVRGVDLVAHAGEVTVVLGPNGAGKTTTVEHLEGYLPRRAGHVSVLGADPQRDRRSLRRRVGVMLQSGGIPTAIRPKELLAQYASFFDRARDPTELLATVGLTGRARTPYRRLSGGEQQRLSLALAIVGDPEVVFLDEPTAGVDLDGRRLIRQLVADMADRGTTVVLTTHDLSEAEQLADRVVIIDRGAVVAAGPPGELVAGDDTAFHFSAARGLEVAQLAHHLGREVTSIAPGEYRVAGAPDPAVVAELTAWLAENDLPLGDLRAGRGRLEDVFRRLTGGDGG